MPVTITLNDLAVALRVSVSPSQPPPAPYKSILEALLKTATEAVTVYATEAPEATANQAVVQMAGYLFDQPAVTRKPSEAFIFSGARALLASWRSPMSTVVH